MSYIIICKQNQIKMKKFTIYSIILLLSITIAKAQVNPVSPAQGFTIFVEGDAELKTNETESNIAIGGDLIIKNSNYRIANNTAGSVYFGTDTRPTGLLVNGKVLFQSGQGITINSNAWVKIGDCTGAYAYDVDNNGAKSNLRVTPGSYNSSTRISSNTKQPANTVCAAGLIDFAAAFNEMRYYNTELAALPSNIYFLDQNGNPLSDPNNPQQTAKLKLTQNTLNVLNITPTTLNKVKNLTFLNLNSNSPIIINVDGGGQDFSWTVPAFGGQNPNYIFWNFINIPNLKLTGGNTMDGTLYAPNSNVEKNNAANIQGSVIVKTLKHFQGEIHENPWAKTFSMLTVPTLGPVCNSNYSSDSIAFDGGLFNKVDNQIYGIDGIQNNWASAFGDYDGDGYVDLFVANYSPDSLNQLYHNNGDGTFTKIVSGNPIVTDVASSTSGVWGDYDNDGDLDLYVSNNIGYKNFLYRNEGGGTFTSIQNDPIVNYTGYSHGAAWADYDNDGFLDMFVADYFPTGFNKLYHNNGDGTFEEVTSSPLVTDAAFSVSPAWGDYDNDGDQDLFVANTTNQKNFLYRNDGNGQFTKITSGAIVNDETQSVGASWGDYDNDGDLDLFVANSGGQNNLLYQNNGDGTFTKITNSVVTTSGGNSHGSAWADIDNDGDLDLLVTNDQDEDNFLYINNGDGTFVAANNEVTNDAGKSFGSAFADIDNDGDLDLHIANHDNEENFLYINEYGTCNNSACFTLVGTKTNTSAYGTKVKVKATINGVPTWQMREVTSLTGGGIGGQNDSRVSFGLGDATKMDSIIIYWASGLTEIFTNVGNTNNSCKTITEIDGSTVCGVVYNDANGNCQQDKNEEGIANITVLAQPGNRQAYTNENGEYEFNLEPGTYTVTALDNTVWQQSCTPTTNKVIVAGVGKQYCGYDFAVTSACKSPDLYIELATTALRVGFENLYAITFGNNGTQTANNAVFKVDFGQDIIPLTASLPWDLQSGTTYTWNIGTVEVGQEFTIYIEDSVAATALIGSHLTVIAKIGDKTSSSDCNASDNLATDVNLAVGAIDPNDIQVSPEGFIAKDQELTYKIRFQNVGNDVVRTVVLRDELPEGLDLTTLVRGSASHPYQFRIEGERTLVWEFSNINLEDSTSNEPESHGFATFKIMPKQDLTDGTELANKAAIFFDNSAPVITNTVINTIGEPSKVKAGDMVIYPNPMSSFTTFRIIPRQAALNEEEIQSIEIYSTLGVKVLELNGLTGTRVTIEKAELTTGYYIVKIKSNKGTIYSSKLLVH
jgi:choice-of-anchor A domain-containing protein/uncharacterized repeat protein (TIGR01451 family)